MTGPDPHVPDGLSDAIALLRGFPTATIYEAAGKAGALPRSIQGLADGTDLSGFAFTVRCEPYETLAVLRAIDLAAPGDVLVVDTGEEGATVWGGTSTIAAQQRCLAGLVTNGAIRDWAEVRDSGFPVFASGRSLRGTNKAAPGIIGAAIDFNGVTVTSGDFVCGDDDGVVIVPADLIIPVARAARLQREKEEALDAALRDGARLTDLLGL